jgi:DNA adenine methylase
MKSPIKYFGGKGNMFNEIKVHFPADDQYKVYVEPFGGSAAMLLARPLTGHVEIYNDIFENVYSLFKCLSDKALFEELKAKCDLAIYSAQIRKEYKEKLKDQLGLVERAYYYWYVNRTSHNGIGGWSVNCCIRRKMSKATSDFLSCIDRLPELHDRLSAVIIENRDAVELMKKYDQSNVFIYADPPYHHETRGTHRYVHDYTDEQHESFIDACLASNAKVLISGYACKPYERLETKFKRFDFDVKTIDGTFEKKTKVESLWKNY